MYEYLIFINILLFILMGIDKYNSIKKKTRSVKQGLAVENCPHCGDNVDADENFCNKCGYSIYAETKCNKCNSLNKSTDEL